MGYPLVNSHSYRKFTSLVSKSWINDPLSNYVSELEGCARIKPNNELPPNGRFITGIQMISGFNGI